MVLENLKRLFENRSDLRLIVENWPDNVEHDPYQKGSEMLTARIEDARSKEVIQSVDWHYQFNELMIALDKKCKDEWS